jgi:hypothetical protein
MVNWPVDSPMDLPAVVVDEVVEVPAANVRA